MKKIDKVQQFLIAVLLVKARIEEKTKCLLSFKTTTNSCFLVVHLHL